MLCRTDQSGGGAERAREVLRRNGPPFPSLSSSVGCLCPANILLRLKSKAAGASGASFTPEMQNSGGGGCWGLLGAASHLLGVSDDARPIHHHAYSQPESNYANLISGLN